MYPLYTMNAHKCIPDLLQRFMYIFNRNSRELCGFSSEALYLKVFVRSKLNSPNVSVLITNTARTSSLRKCCHRHYLLRPQNKTTLLRLFWGRFSAWITALTQTRCTREVFVISTLTVGLSSSERAEIFKKNTMPHC